jgi:WhiB family transcriptional regulator, redox-sensing transcriptional regulator
MIAFVHAESPGRVESGVRLSRTRGCELSPTKEQAWRLRGACRGADPEIFYPVSEEDAIEAKAICATCGVREPCLEFALANRERDGVWGGATERERRRMLRQRRRSA